MSVTIAAVSNIAIPWWFQTVSVCRDANRGFGEGGIIFSDPPARGGGAKSFPLNLKHCRVTWAYSERVDLYSRQIMKVRNTCNFV
jgi:hypothetical protein